VLHAQLDAMVVAEVELGQVASQVLLSTVLTDTLHPTLEQSKVYLEMSAWIAAFSGSTY
jgi:hypothetical protein